MFIIDYTNFMRALSLDRKIMMKPMDLDIDIQTPPRSISRKCRTTWYVTCSEVLTSYPQASTSTKAKTW